MTDYAQIGLGYAERRLADPRLFRPLRAAIGDAETVVNVGAGTGNYEPSDCIVVAVEPSETMLAQRAPSAAPAVRAFAEALPFRDDAFDVAMGVLTVHHWSDRARGLEEVQRVARRLAILYFEPTMTDDMWVLEYWPEILDLPSENDPPGEQFFRRHLDVRDIVAVPVPVDCIDGFSGAYWARPEAYLDPGVRAGMSSFAQLDPGTVGAGTARLRADLESGRWDARHGSLRTLAEYDIGYRIVTT